jgi:hypothetical protein
LARQLDQSLKASNLDEYRSTLVEFIKEHSAESDLAWGDLIAELLRQWEAKQSGLTPGASASRSTACFPPHQEQRTALWPPAEPDQGVVAETPRDR